MLKNIIVLLSFFFFLSHESFGQEKLEKFCQIRFIGGKNPTAISFGQADSLFSFKDSLILHNLKKVENFKTEPDVMNYMSSLKWELVSVFIFHPGEQYFYYKKSFSLNDLN